MEWLDRLTAVMDIVSERTDGVTFTEIQQATFLKKGTLHRLLRELVDRRYLGYIAATKRYRLGPKAMEWGGKFVLGQDPAGVLSAYCDALAVQTGLCCYSCQLSAGEVYCFYTRQPSSDHNRYFLHVGQRMPFHCAAAAKAIYAFQPQEQIGLALGGQPLKKYTDYTKTDPEEIARDLAAVRESLVAFCWEEMEYGAIALATPVFFGTDQVHYSIGLIGDMHHIKKNQDALVTELRSTGCAASKELQMTWLLSSHKN